MKYTFMAFMKVLLLFDPVKRRFTTYETPQLLSCSSYKLLPVSNQFLTYMMG